jgi:sugar phosphate isomerase/epimerase
MYEALKRTKAMGYEAVQYNTPSYMTKEEYKAMLDEFDLPCLCCAGGFEDMLKDPKAVEAAAKLADFFGTPFVDVNSLPLELRTSADGFKKYAAEISTVGKRLKEYGKTVLYHNHALEFISLGEGHTGMEILINETDPDSVNFILDTHWLVGGGVYPPDWIRKVKGRMKICHFKDYAIVNGAQKSEQICKQFAPVGEGNIDWPPIVAACREAGVEYCVVEQDKCMRDPFDCAQSSINHMIKFGV